MQKQTDCGLKETQKNKEKPNINYHQRQDVL